MVRKLGHPGHPELALGAIAEDGVRIVDQALMRATGVDERRLAPVEARERAELERRATRYRGHRPPTPIAGRNVVIVDDGLATGSTASAAAIAVRHRGAARIVVAVPVASAEAVRSLRRVADDVVAVTVPQDFRAVGEWYDDFRPTADEEVIALLASTVAHDPPAHRYDAVVPADGVVVEGWLDVPEHATGVVVFAHGSGSSRFSPRNQEVARALQARGIATLLLDLLTPAEAGDRSRVFDIDLLADRLDAARRWLATSPAVRNLPVGMFGASTGAGAAIVAAARRPAGVPPVAAVVSRGGRVDLAGAALGAVRCPVLLVVGGADGPTLDANRAAARRLVHADHRLEVVPRAGHLFEEPGALDHVARVAGDFFVTHLRCPEVATR
jgi:putative phosphoribosyl transferase